MAFRDLTIRRKLAVLTMGVSATAVALAAVVFYVVTIAAMEKTYRAELSGIAQVLGRNCEASVAFGLPEDAAHLLTSLSARPSVVEAVITDSAGAPFARYGRGTPAAPAGLAGAGTGGLVVVSEEIVVDRRVVGRLSLYDDARGIARARTLAAGTLALALVVSLLAAWAFAAPLQRLVSGPITSLAAATDRITREHDFSLRAKKHGNDEVGRLVESFNAMLGMIESGNAELTRSEASFRTLVEQAADAFYLFEPDGAIADVNERACEILGYARAELLGAGVAAIDEGAACPAAWGVLRPDAPVTREGALRRKDGALVPVEMRLGIIEVGGARRVLGLARDISERREAEAERARLETQLQQSQRMEAIGALAGGVAHDFNNILSAIIGYASLMQGRTAPGDPQHHHLEQILAAAARAEGLTRSLLAFSRRQVVELRPVELNELIRGFQKILARLIGEDISFTVECAPGRLVVEADPGQIEQVLMNLVTNARDAMPKGGAILIATSSVELDAASIAAHNVAAPGAYAYVTVSDTGVGMDRRTQTHIFEPFFTTKEVGRGTGLGLSIVYGIVKKHNGSINVYSEPGKGTTFKIYLPLSAAAAPAPAEQPVAAVPRGTETILLVEDNESVLAMMQAVLEEHGYTVLAAADGERAIDLLRENRDRVALVVSDLVMPGMNGREAYEAMRAIRPDLPAVFSSGYAADIIARKGILEEGINFVPKPVNPGQMLRKIRAVLDRAAAEREGASGA